MGTDRLGADLKVLADHFQYWLDWQAKDRAKEGLAITGDSHLMLHTPTDGVTPPTWPTRNAMEGIVALLREAGERLEDLHEAGLEAKFYDKP